MDQHSEARLAPTNIIPMLAEKIRVMYAALMTQQIEIRVVQGLRSFDEQMKIWLQGRNGNPGPIVTKARPGYSMHNFGLAVDCMPDTVWGVPWTPDPDAKDIHYAKMVAAGMAQGLDCGANWHSIHDTPHFQLAGLPETPSDVMRADLASGGLNKVWSNVLSGAYSQ